MSRFVVHQGEIVRRDDVKISPFNRGMMYGDGCFETFRCYQGKFLALEQSYQRLRDALSYLKVDFTVSYQELKKIIQSLVVANGFEKKDSYLRIQCWRKGERGYGTTSSEMEYVIENGSISTNPKPVRLQLSEIPLIPNEALQRSFKLSNGLNYINAGSAALASGFEDAIMLTLDGILSETTIANVFWGSGNLLFTPSADLDCLAGLTRNRIIECIAASEEFELIEGHFKPEALEEASFAFCTNSVREIYAVAGIDRLQFDPEHPSIEALKRMFEEYKHQNLHT